MWHSQPSPKICDGEGGGERTKGREDGQWRRQGRTGKEPGLRLGNGRDRVEEKELWDRKKAR